MVIKDPIHDGANETSLDLGPKGHSRVPMHRKAFPLDEDNIKHNILNTGFNASYGEDNGDVIHAVKSLDPYLHPKNQILLRALIKGHSLLGDISSLVNVPVDVSINEISVKPLTVKEGLVIAQKMSPYLSPHTRQQVESVSAKIHKIDELKSGLTKVKAAETTELKVEYILQNLRHFMPSEKYNQIKQVVNIVKVFQTSNALSETKNAIAEGNETEDIVSAEQKENEQLSDIMSMLDKVTNKKNTE